MTPKWHWTLQVQNVPHILVFITIVQESQISIRFTLRPAFFDIQAILRQVHWMTPKWPWTVQDQRYPRNVTSVQESQISIRFALRPALFEIQAILRQVHRMTAKWPWTLPGHMCPIYMLAVSISPKFHSISLYDEPFSRYRLFLPLPKWECSSVPHFLIVPP